MKNERDELNNRFHQADLSYIQKKGRKNSTPNVTLTVTSSPDGALTFLCRFNFGSHSESTFLMCLESIIGKLITYFDINSLSVLPSILTICFSSFVVMVGGTTPGGYFCIVLFISSKSPTVKSLHTTVASLFPRFAKRAINPMEILIGAY